MAAIKKKKPSAKKKKSYAMKKVVKKAYKKKSFAKMKAVPHGTAHVFSGTPNGAWSLFHVEAPASGSAIARSVGVTKSSRAHLRSWLSSLSAQGKLPGY